MTRIPNVRRTRTRAVTCIAAAVLAVAACDTGDGTELRDPTSSTTLPPPPTSSSASTPLDSASPFLPVETDSATLPAPADLGTGPAGSSAEQDFSLTAPWVDGGQIDIAYTCEGADDAPALSWSGVPDATAELAVSMVDESDVDDGRPAIGWTMTGIVPNATGLGAGEVPPGAQVALNVFGETAYTGPCPALGENHTYTITVYALAEDLDLSEGTPAGQVVDLIGTLATATASVSGTFGR